jgi:hypothetical protein
MVEGQRWLGPSLGNARGREDSAGHAAFASLAERLDAPAAERAKPWWRFVPIARA